VKSQRKNDIANAATSNEGGGGGKTSAA